MGGRETRTAPRGAAAAIAVALLVVVGTVALRGYVPGAEPTPPPAPADNPASAVFVVGLVIAAGAVATLAVVTRWRQLGTDASSVAARPDWLRTSGERPSRRVIVIALFAVVAWLLAVAWLGSLGGGQRSETGTLKTPEGSPPATSPATSPTPAPSPPSPTDDSSQLLGYLAAATAVIMTVLVVGSIHAARARRREVPWPVEIDEPASAPEVATESLARAAEVGLAEVGDLSREPRGAIIACYAAMERQLERVPDAVPQDFDTASEVLERAVRLRALGPNSATRLVELFDEARFSPHVMDEGHRADAIEVLQRVLGELRSLT